MSLPLHHPPDLPQLDPSLAITHADHSDTPPSVSTKNLRRGKPHIELAPDQPLTTQGRPRARVFVACLQCRTRKIRCDGAKPACHNCTRRAKSTETCVYDAAPKRRGPDKTPGARQRMSREGRQETDPNAIAPRQTRRKRHATASPPPQHHFQTPFITAYPPAPSRQPSIVLDPQLADIPSFHPTPADFSSPVNLVSSLTGPGSAMLLPPDGTVHHMATPRP